MDRRSFLKSILAAGVAPAIVGSGILMPVRKLLVPPQEIVEPILSACQVFHGLSPIAVRLYSEALFRELQRDQLMLSILGSRSLGGLL